MYTVVCGTCCFISVLSNAATCYTLLTVAQRCNLLLWLIVYLSVPLYTTTCQLLQMTDTQQQQQRAQQLGVVVSIAMGGFVSVVDRFSAAAELAAVAAAVVCADSASTCAELSAEPSAGVLLTVRACAQSCYDEYAATAAAATSATTTTAAAVDTVDVQHSARYEQAVQTDSILNLSTTATSAGDADSSSSAKHDVRTGSRSGSRSSARSSTGVHSVHSSSSNSARAAADNDAHSDCDSEAGRSVHVAQVQCDVSETDISVTDYSVTADADNCVQQQPLLSSRSDASSSSIAAIDTTTAAAAAEAVTHAAVAAPVVAVAVASRKQQGEYRYGFTVWGMLDTESSTTTSGSIYPQFPAGLGWEAGVASHLPRHSPRGKIPNLHNSVQSTATALSKRAVKPTAAGATQQRATVTTLQLAVDGNSSEHASSTAAAAATAVKSVCISTDRGTVRIDPRYCSDLLLLGTTAEESKLSLQTSTLTSLSRVPTGNDCRSKLPCNCSG
jgi:hypothetical protein